MSEPKKRKRKIPEKKTTETKIPEAEKIDINHLFLQALARHKNDPLLEDKKNKLKEISRLCLIAEEYMSTFALIGYSLQDEKVVVLNASTPKNEAALVDLIRSTFFDIASNRP
jgi:hypothetical protein